MEGTWKSYVANKIPIDLRYMTRCNIKFADLPFKFEKNNIWNEIWLQWCMENHRNDIDTVELILNQNLWFNSHIRKNKKVIFLKEWENRGMRWISDLLYENDTNNSLRFLSQKELEDMYDLKTDFLTYGSTIHAIPTEWRRKLKIHDPNQDNDDEDHDDYKLVDQLLDNDQPSRLIYNAKITYK